MLDADTAVLRPVATFEGPQLGPMVQPVGASSSASDRLSLTGGGHSVLFMFVAFDAGARVPNRIRHRIVTNNGSIDGADIGTQSTQLLDLGSPLAGAEWHALSGPGNDSNHRRGILAFDGKAAICRRYAIDWVLMRDGARFAGNALDNASYYAYGQEVFAVTAGRVVSVVNGIPDNVPDRERFGPAVPLSMDTLFGNSIVLDVGDGQFAHYLHLQPNSVLVKPGDRVRRGDVLARVGNSGDSRQPHLHFELTNSAKPILGEGVPYVLSRYRARLPDGSWQTRMRELPLSDTVIDFGTGR